MGTPASGKVGNSTKQREGVGREQDRGTGPREPAGKLDLDWEAAECRSPGGQLGQTHCQVQGVGSLGREHKCPVCSQVLVRMSFGDLGAGRRPEQGEGTCVLWGAGHMRPTGSLREGRQTLSRCGQIAMKSGAGEGGLEEEPLKGPRPQASPGWYRQSGMGKSRLLTQPCWCTREVGWAEREVEPVWTQMQQLGDK